MLEFGGHQTFCCSSCPTPSSTTQTATVAVDFTEVFYFTFCTGFEG